MRIAVLCATRRGYRFLQKLIALAPEADLVVFSFREESIEPSFMNMIQTLTESSGGQFLEARQAGAERLAHFWEATPIDLMFFVSWRYMVPSPIYQRARLGAYVFHDSLLPAYRGFAPTVWAIINGEPQTGVSLFRIADEVDAGDIIAQQAVPIGPDDTITDILERVTDVYLEVLEATLPALIDGTAQARPQDHSRATFTCKRLPEDNRIDWHQSSATIYNLIRAVTRPYSGAYTSLNGKKLTVWSAQRIPQKPYAGRIPGRIVDIRAGEGSVVLTGDGMLLLKRVQVEGDEERNAAEVLNRLSFTLGR